MSDDQKRLLTLLKGEQAIAALQLLKAAVMKKDVTRTQALPVDEQQKAAAQMSELVEDQWGKDKPAASEEYSRELQGLPAPPPEQHFLEDHMPHLESPVKPWLLYEVGMGGREGRPLNHGAPMDNNEVMMIMESGQYDPHRMAIRPSDKSKPWMSIKTHANFRDGVSRHIASQHSKFHQGEIPVAEYENVLPKDFESLNPKDLERIHATHKRR